MSKNPEDKLEVDLNSEGNAEGIIALLNSTIKGLEGLKGRFRLKLSIRER